MGQPSRGAFTVLATFLVLAISFDSSPTRPSPPSPMPAGHRPPDPREIALVDELTGRAAHPADADLRVMRRADLDAALAPASAPHLSELWHGAALPRAESEVVKKLPFGRAIVRAAERHGVDPLLLAAMVETESGFAPDAVSSEGAIGLLQLIPETGELYGKTDLFDPYVNLEVGSQYIGALLDRYHGDMALALAAYNCGPATVTRYGAVPPFPETRDFVKSVLALYVQHRQKAWKREKESAEFRMAMARGGAGEQRSTPATPATSAALAPPASRSSVLLGR